MNPNVALTKTRKTFLQVCSIVLIICGGVGFWYITQTNEAQPKDVLYTILFLAAGIYFYWFSKNAKVKK